MLTEDDESESLTRNCWDVFLYCGRVLRKPRLLVGALALFDLEMMRSALDPILEPFVRGEVNIFNNNL